jgi:hypothetical protein
MIVHGSGHHVYPQEPGIWLGASLSACALGGKTEAAQIMSWSAQLMRKKPSKPAGAQRAARCLRVRTVTLGYRTVAALDPKQLNAVHETLVIGCGIVRGACPGPGPALTTVAFWSL